VAQQGGGVVLADVRRPEPRGEGVPEVLEVEAAGPGLLICIYGYPGGELVFKHGVAVNPQSDGGAEAREKVRAV
jgi:hypothetical protein